MFKLERGNVVKIVATEHEKAKLMAKGFIEIKDDVKKETKSNKVTKEKATK